MSLVWVSPVIAAVVAFIGWQIANRQANRRETRKEVRADIAEAMSEVHRLCNALREHQKCEKQGREAILSSSAIRQNLQLVELRLARILERSKRSGISVQIDQVRTAQEDFFDKTSGDLLDGDAAITEDEWELMLLSQYSAAAQLEHALLNFFISEFKTK